MTRLQPPEPHPRPDVLAHVIIYLLPVVSLASGRCNVAASALSPSSWPWPVDR